MWKGESSVPLLWALPRGCMSSLFSEVWRLFCTPEDAFEWLCLFTCCPFGDRLTGFRLPSHQIVVNGEEVNPEQIPPGEDNPQW